MSNIHCQYVANMLMIQHLQLLALSTSVHTRQLINLVLLDLLTMSIYGDRSVNQARIQQSPSVVGPINTTDPSHQDHLSTSKICKWLRTFSQFHRTSSHDIARFTVSWNSKDLSALRLVCREASDKVFDIFLDVHFSTFTVLITQEESLRTLLAIAQYERFARAIRRLVFCTDIVAERPPEQCRLKMDPEIAALPRPSDKDIKRNQKQAVARQRRPRHCAVDLELLTEIFTALARVGGAFEVDVTVMERNAGYAPLRPWGSKTLQVSCGQKLHPDHKDKRAS